LFSVRFVLYPSNPEQDFVNIKVYDYNDITSSKLLGELEYAVPLFMGKRERERENDTYTLAYTILGVLLSLSSTVL
jgi:hypothetical protein